MNQRKPLAGFTQFELLITVAIIVILSAAAVPAYRSYISTANMARVTANFEESVRVAQRTITEDETRLAQGLTALAPKDTNGWITLLNTTGAHAPEGGPAYIAKKNGDATTGAIGVEWKEASKGKLARLEVWRPRYLDLTELHAMISNYKVETN